MDAAIHRSVRFLRASLHTGNYGLACIGDDGEPRFSDNKGHVFVNAFITEALAGLLEEIDRSIVLVRILSEEVDGQWGFSPAGPYHGADTLIYHVDADDTAYVIRTLRRLGVNRPPSSLLTYRREPDGLFATFNSPGQVSMTADPSPANNLLAHPEVNANIMLALRGTHLERYANYDILRRTQDSGGGWPSYFYPSPFYATLLALDALAGNASFSESIARGLAFIADSQNADGSWGDNGDAHETALAVAALACHQNYRSHSKRGSNYLIATAAPDGSWTTSAPIWEFHFAKDDIWRAYDLHRAYVTARCVVALRRVAGELTPLS
jgi:hypothetical protein